MTSVADPPVSARLVLTELIAVAGGAPDGRPLYRYRFTREQFDRMSLALRREGSAGLRFPAGSALFVAYVAEWFRRDREGGAWDWKRPLAGIGVTYGQDLPTANLSYAELAYSVEQGLGWWRRPAPASGQRITAVVREAGFPAAALRNGRAILSWLQNAVRLIERGFAPRDAVAAEAWRMQAQSVVQATFDVAVSLCEALADLRATVRSLAPDAADPIAVLEIVDPAWRDRLPIDLEVDDVLRVIETVIRARLDSNSALKARRTLRRDGSGWRADVGLVLSGDVDIARLPAPVSERLAMMARARIAPRGRLVGTGSALAALETLHDDDQLVGWRVRPLVDNFDVPLALEDDVRLGLLAADGRLLEEFVAEGGDGLALPVIALGGSVPSAPEDVDEWEVLGCSSARTNQVWLGLAVANDSFDRLTIDGERRVLGAIGARRTLLAISGVARLDLGDGLSLSWRTGADESACPRLLVFGPILRGPRETTYRGVPRVLLDADGSRREFSPDRVMWRGRSGGWRPMSEGGSWGRIQVGVAGADGTLQAVAGITVVPPELDLRANNARKRLTVSGVGGAAMAALAGEALMVVADGSARIVDLSNVEPARTIELTFAWGSPATLTLPNPVTRRAFLDPSGRLAARHEKLSIGGLYGWRLLTSGPALICFELTARSGLVRSFTRPTEGEAPLIAFLDDIRNLLGSSDALDGALRLSWIGDGDWFCEIRRYEDATDILAAGGDAADGERARLLGITNVSALDLGDLDSDPLAIDLVRLPVSSPRQQRPQGGPWLIFGRTGSGGIIRPGVLAGRGIRADDEPLTALMCNPLGAEREAGLLDLMQADVHWSEPTIRRWTRLIAFASGQGVPYTAFDALRLLHRRPAAAVRLLSEASAGETQRAVLSLQRETPLVWVATPIGSWIDAFDRRLKRLEAQLSEAGLEREIALQDLQGAASRLLDAAPSLAVHVQAVVLALCGGPGRRPVGFDELAARFAEMCPAPSVDSLEQGINAFVQRHVDGPRPPTGLELAGRSSRAEPWVRRFPDVFADVIAAPFVAADAARGAIRLDRTTAAACRAAWLFDPDHFETTSSSACRAA